MEPLSCLTSCPHYYGFSRFAHAINHHAPLCSQRLIFNEQLLCPWKFMECSPFSKMKASL